jgi:hypothetical protein
VEKGNEICNESGKCGATLNNTATLTNNGTELIGKRVVTGSPTSETGYYEYTWKASKLK